MLVADLMKQKLETVHPEATVADAIVTLADAHVSALPVVDEHGRVLGVVSNTDILLAEAERDEHGVDGRRDRTSVRDIMTPHALTVTPEVDVREAARRMLDAEVHRLFVASDGRLVGVISSTDIVRAVATGRI